MTTVQGVAASPSRLALLIEPDLRHARSLARVMKTALDDVVICAGLREVPQASEWTLVVASCDALSEDDQTAVLDRFAGHLSASRLLLYSTAQGRSSLSSMLGGRGLTNFLASDGAVDPQELLVTTRKLIGGDVFGLEKYFPWGAQAHTLDLRRSEERNDVRQAAREFAERFGVRSRMSELFCTVTDEFITNALYNAPVDGEGARRFAHLQRGVPIELEASETVTVNFCSDGQRLGCSVSDSFGSLEEPIIVEYLVRCFKKGENQISERSGGAGLGLFTVFKNVSHFVVNLDPGRRTEMIGLIDIRGTFREFAESGKSFNVFMAGAPGERA